MLILICLEYFLYRKKMQPERYSHVHGTNLLVPATRIVPHPPLNWSQETGYLSYQLVYSLYSSSLLEPFSKLLEKHWDYSISLNVKGIYQELRKGDQGLPGRQIRLRSTVKEPKTDYFFENIRRA